MVGLSRRARSEPLTHYSALCPPRHGSSPLLHHPITLPCGHTLSARHLSIPPLPSLQLAPDLPQHEIFAAQQAHQHQRLNVWGNVMCPIPTCKRYNPTASATPVVEVPEYSTGSPTLTASRGGDVLASGVVYYPPPPPVSSSAPPAYSTLPPAHDTTPPLLDVTVDKLIDLVTAERHRRDNRFVQERTSTALDSDTGESDDEGDLIEHHHRQLSVSMGRQLSKRRRNTLRTLPHTQTDNSSEWPFLKELSGICECDVCAMMLHDPVTTPCQHVSCVSFRSR